MGHCLCKSTTMVQLLSSKLPSLLRFKARNNGKLYNFNDIVIEEHKPLKGQENDSRITISMI
jgi:hypothetical protein